MRKCWGLEEEEDWREVVGRPSCWRWRCCLSLHTPLYAAARLVLAVFWLSITVWSMVDFASKYAFGYYFTKLTYITAFIELLYFVLLFALASLAMRAGDDKRMPGGILSCLLPLASVLFALVPIATFLVFVVYWAVVYNGNPVTTLSVMLHGGNFVLAFVDFLFVRFRLRCQHVFIPMGFGVGYSLFTLIYYFAGGTSEDGDKRYIYSVLDWSKPLNATLFLSVLVFAVVPALFFVFNGVLVLRILLLEGVEEASGEAETDETSVFEDHFTVSSSKDLELSSV